MADSGKWEIVRAKPKTAKPKTATTNTINNGNSARNGVGDRNKLSKSEAREYLDRMPRLSLSAPIRESEVMYNVLTDKGSRKASANNRQHGSVHNNNNINYNNDDDNNQVVDNRPLMNGDSKEAKRKALEKERPRKVVEKPPKSLEEALRKIQPNELRAVMQMVQMRFPESCNIWLKDLISYLNIKLNVDVADPTFAGKDANYPLSSAPKDVRHVIESTIERCVDPSLVAQSFERCLLDMADDMTHGHRCNGHRLVLQALVRSRPSLVTQNLLLFENLRNTYQSRPAICLALLWVAGVAGAVQLDIGLKVWLEVMLPVLGIRTYSKYVVDYLRTLLSLYPDFRINAGSIMGVYHFFPVLDIVFNNTVNLPTGLHKDLVVLFPKLRNMAFSNKPETNLRNYFPSLLARLDHSCGMLVKNELLRCLVQCLRTDSQCFSVWKQLYTRHLVNSSLLLEHLVEKLDVLGPNIPLLKKTLGEFNAANQKLSNSTEKAALDGLRQCRRHCTEVLSKTKMDSVSRERVVVSSERSSILRPILFVLFVALSSAIMYDYQLHGSFKASKTRRLMLDYGVIGAYDVVTPNVVHYYNLSYKWASKNVPQYCAVVSKFSEPFVSKALDWLLLAGNYALVIFGYIQLIVVVCVSIFVDKVDAWFPGIVEIAFEYIVICWSVIFELTVVGWTYAVYFFNIASVFICEKVLTGPLAVDNLQHVMGTAVNTVQSYTVDIFNWIHQQLHTTK